jgi:2-oxoglutarate ferredoxin oxidoreductase subunit beta
MLYVVMDNSVYSLTEDHPSPTSEADWDSDIASGGNGRRPFNPLAVAIASGVNYVACNFAGDPNGLADVIVDGIR